MIGAGEDPGLGRGPSVAGAGADYSLHEQLERLSLAQFFSAVITTARKPSPDGFLRALESLGVEPGRALHVGDDAGDEEGSRAAGMHFAAAPLLQALEGLE